MSNGWLKLAGISFIGIIVSSIMLGAVNSNGNTQQNQMYQYQMMNQMPGNTYMGQGQMPNMMQGTNQEALLRMQLEQMKLQLLQMQNMINSMHNGMNMNGMNNNNMNNMGNGMGNANGMSSNSSNSNSNNNNMGGMGMM